MACKVIDVPPNKDYLEKSFLKELAAYTELSGPYILKTYGYGIRALPNSMKKYTLVMEFMSRGSLAHVLEQKEKLSLRRKIHMACHIASGMRKIHSHSMIHRDIRPDNILVTQDYIAKIGDMGIARVWMPDEALTLIGCQSYMPLEFFYLKKYDQSLDVFTFGLTLNELFTEKQHNFDNVTRRIKLICESPILSGLINRCIHVIPSQRPSASEIETTLYMYKHAVEKYIGEQNITYGDMSLDEKNSTFVTACETLRPSIDETLKDNFPRPSPLDSSSSLGELSAAAGLNEQEAKLLQLLDNLEKLNIVDRNE